MSAKQTPMKKFAGVKPLHQIKTQCAAAGVAYDDYNFRTGADYVCLGIAHGMRPDGSPLVYANAAHGAWVMFNTFNGTFFGQTSERQRFSSSETTHEDKPWFQALLSFFYVEKGQACAPKNTTMVQYTLGGVALALAEIA